MNRLQCAAAVSGRRENRQQYNHGLSQPRDIDLRFQRFLPLHYEPNYAYPLVVWLHGPTGSEIEISQVLPLVSMRNYVGISPRGAIKHEAVHVDGAPTFTWDQSLECVRQATDDVLQCVETTCDELNIAAHRVFLAGHDVGGSMALRIALAHPDVFAGVASIGGGIPVTDCPLAEFSKLRSLPVLMMYGRDSACFGADEVCADLRLMHAAGMPVHIRQYPCGQEVTTKMLSDLNVWLMDQVSGAVLDTPTMDDPTSQFIRNQN